MSSNEEFDVSDSSSEVHPNIDERSYKNWKRQKKEEEKRMYKIRLEELENKKDKTQQENEEIEELKNKVKPQYVTHSVSECITSTNVEVKDIDYSTYVLQLLEDSSIDNFIQVVLDKHLDINALENFVLYNLSENIKEGNETAGILLCKISMYIGYLKKCGTPLLHKLCIELKYPDKKEAFDKDVLLHYRESEAAILSLQE